MEGTTRGEHDPPRKLPREEITKRRNSQPKKRPAKEISHRAGKNESRERRAEETTRGNDPRKRPTKGSLRGGKGHSRKRLAETPLQGNGPPREHPPAGTKPQVGCYEVSFPRTVPLARFLGSFPPRNVPLANGFLGEFPRQGVSAARRSLSLFSRRIVRLLGYDAFGRAFPRGSFPRVVSLNRFLEPFPCMGCFATMPMFDGALRCRHCDIIVSSSVGDEARRATDPELMRPIQEAMLAGDCAPTERHKESGHPGKYPLGKRPVQETSQWIDPRRKLLTEGTIQRER